jgi:serine/threonine protein kinase
MAFVYETTVQGHKLAWKKMSFRRKLGAKETQEVEILKKLSHPHMIQLIGTYTHQKILGMLLYPVAVCDLHTFFDDAEAHWRNESDDSQMDRLGKIGYFPSVGSTLKHKAWPIYSQIGCLVSAIAYLHSKSIRHKDLKPSNILLSRGRLYLSDFGNATDFSLLSRSATDHGGGTPLYLSPEVNFLNRTCLPAFNDMFVSRLPSINQVGVQRTYFRSAVCS